ncbi:RNA-binding domain-containing protein [Aquipuribacter sp. MA13-6]|uniref:RNA-binding domain-containing protein n=1 Tax=unclassified Aquipuribacter TaxID=2635084 RepID=UPI003EEC5D41
MTTTALIGSGEDLTTEFKRQVNDRDLVRAVTCLANSQGGVLLVGVEDDGTVVGANPRHGEETLPHRVAALIQNSTEPSLAVSVRIDVVQGLDVLRVDIPAADPAPVATKDGVFTKRVLDPHGLPQCVPMTPHEIVSMGMVTRGMDYAASVAREATDAHLDPREFDRFRRLCRSSGDQSMASLSDGDILRALGLRPAPQQVSLGAVLLFGTENAVARWIPAAEVLFQDLREDHLLDLRLTGPLLKVAEEVRRILDARDSVTELSAGLLRVEVPLIPSVTRRETVANALVHRDYSELGPIRIQISRHEFTVASAGGFPPGVTVANLLDQSRPRSPIIADAFKRAGLVDRRGKGVNDMFEQQLRAGRDEPDYSRTTSDSVVVGVALGTADLDLVRFLLTFENETQRTLGLDEIRLLHEVKASGSATGTELAEATNMLPATTRVITTRLVEAGLLEARGSGRSRRFHLTARFYDLAQDRNAYVRVKGADPLQQQRMVLDYVSAYGSVTRGQAAQLCQTSPAQARVILKRLVEGGQLRLVGERRGSHYVLP